MRVQPALRRIGVALAVIVLPFFPGAACVVAATPHADGTRILFDDAHAETAGNADWIVSTSQPDPLQEDSTPSAETDWTGALSSWGIALHKEGDQVQTLPPGDSLSYGDNADNGDQDLSRFDVLVLPEPNVLLTDAEKTAVMSFVQDGGGLFMISDHHGSDRNNDGADAVDVLNDLMTANSVDSTDPFGFSVDVKDISTDDPDGVSGNDPILDGPHGTVKGTIIRSGTTATLSPGDDSSVRGEIYLSSASVGGDTGVAFATSGFGSGRVAFWGDSSPIDDGTGQSGNDLYDGWNDPAGDDAALALNATDWLAGSG